MRIIAIALSFLIAVTGVQYSSAQPLPYHEVPTKLAVNMHPEFVRHFLATYDRTMMNKIGPENILPKSVFETILADLRQDFPALTTADPDLLEEMVLRTELAFKLAKNGFPKASEQELVFAVGRGGELFEQLTRAGLDPVFASRIFANAVDSIVDSSLVRLTGLRPQEKARVHAAHKNIEEIVGGGSQMNNVGRVWREKEIEWGSYISLSIMGVGVVGLLGTLLGSELAHSYDYIYFWTKDSIVKYGTIVSVSLIIAGISDMARRTNKIIRPWIQISENQQLLKSQINCKMLLGAP